MAGECSPTLLELFPHGLGVEPYHPRSTLRRGRSSGPSFGACVFLLVTTGQRLAGVEIRVDVVYRFRWGEPTEG